MGNLIIIDQGPIQSTYNNWKVYSSSTKSGTFAVLNSSNGQVLSSSSYYDMDGSDTTWYKSSYYNTSTQEETTLTDPFQPQNEKYTTVRKVEKYFRLPKITDTTTPNIQQVAELIKRAQDKIDYDTGHAWRTRYNGTESGDEQTARFEYYDLEHQFEWHTGRPVYLNHRFIYEPLDATEGDALEVWNGNIWEDWIAIKQEDRGKDYWLNYDMGVLFVNARWGITRIQGVRLKYRYGERKVNATVEDICTKMVMIDLLLGESRSAFIPEGSASALSFGRKIDLMEKQIDAALGRLREFKVVSTAR